jgi:hypothetical protein
MEICHKPCVILKSSATRVSSQFISQYMPDWVSYLSTCQTESHISACAGLILISQYMPDWVSYLSTCRTESHISAHAGLSLISQHMPDWVSYLITCRTESHISSRAGLSLISHHVPDWVSSLSLTPTVQHNLCFCTACRCPSLTEPSKLLIILLLCFAASARYRSSREIGTLQGF